MNNTVIDLPTEWTGQIMIYKQKIRRNGGRVNAEEWKIEVRDAGLSLIGMAGGRSENVFTWGHEVCSGYTIECHRSNSLWLEILALSRIWLNSVKYQLMFVQYKEGTPHLLEQDSQDHVPVLLPASVLSADSIYAFNSPSSFSMNISSP